MPSLSFVLGLAWGWAFSCSLSGSAFFKGNTCQLLSTSGFIPDEHKSGLPVREAAKGGKEREGQFLILCYIIRWDV